MMPTERGLRLGPLHLPVEEEAESLHVKFLLNPPPRRTFYECVRRFNANAPYSGLLYSVTQDVSSENEIYETFSGIKESFFSGTVFRKQRQIDNGRSAILGAKRRRAKEYIDGGV